MNGSHETVRDGESCSCRTATTDRGRTRYDLYYLNGLAGDAVDGGGDDPLLAVDSVCRAARARSAVPMVTLQATTG